MSSADHIRLLTARLARIEREHTYVGLFAIARDLGMRKRERRLLADGALMGTICDILINECYRQYDHATKEGGCA